MSEQTIKAGQKLSEDWEIEYTRLRMDSPIVAHFKHWPHSTIYGVRGEGKTVEEARVNLASNLARAIHQDPNPFGYLGNVVHTSDVIKFLRDVKQGEVEEDSGSTYQPASDWFLPDNLLKTTELPNGWEKVIDSLIILFAQWSDDEALLEEGEVTM